MTTLSGSDIIDLFGAFAVMIEREKDHLSALDGVIGDGDHGVTMSIGFQAVEKDLAASGDPNGPSDVFVTAAKTFLNAVGRPSLRNRVHAGSRRHQRQRHSG